MPAQKAFTGQQYSIMRQHVLGKFDAGYYDNLE